MSDPYWHNAPALGGQEAKISAKRLKARNPSVMKGVTVMITWSTNRVPPLTISRRSWILFRKASGDRTDMVNPLGIKPCVHLMGGVQEFNPKVAENVKATEERFVVLFVCFFDRLGYDLGGRKL